MLRIIHVFPVEKFTIPFMKFANEYLGEYAHGFILYRNGGYDSDLHFDELFKKNDRFDYIEVANLYDHRSKNWLKTANIIILHSLSPIPSEFFALHRRLLGKAVLVIWGGDIYSYRQKPDSFLGRIKWRIKELLKEWCIPRIPCFCGMSGDYVVAQKHYHACGKQFHVQYPSTVEVSVLESTIVEKVEDSIIRIMIGNSSTSTNNHIDAMQKIAKFKDKNIEVIAPLSYGDKAYGDIVTAEGKRIFGNKFTAIRTFMSAEEYTRLLATIDISFFNNNRQQGVGNIELLTYLGAKIYLRTDTSMWKAFQEDGLQYYDASSIETMNFDDFCLISEDIRTHNRDIIKDNWNNYKRSLKWKELLSYMQSINPKQNM